MNTSASFRAISQLFGIFALCLNLKVKKPCHTTVMNWVHKIGVYQLSRKKEKADDWVIVLDHRVTWQWLQAVREPLRREALPSKV